MFHSHEATERHDKIYALLGMSTDAYNVAELLPDYKLPWKVVFYRLIKFLLGEHVSVETQDDMELATIKSNGYVIGRVSSVTPSSGWGDITKVEVVSKTMSGQTKRWTWNLYASANPVQKGDLVYLQKGAPNPTIIRSYNEHFVVIMIAATPPKEILIKELNKGLIYNRYTEWSEFWGMVKMFTHNLLLVWDWRGVGNLTDQEKNKFTLEMNNQVKDQKVTELDVHLGKVIELLQMAIILSLLEGNEEAKKMKEDVKKRCEKHPDMLVGLGNLASIYQSQGRWREAEELGMQVIEIMEVVLGEGHPDTLTSMSNLASTYQSQGKWKQSEELFVLVIEMREKLHGSEQSDGVANMASLASTYQSQGRWKEAEEQLIKVIKIIQKVHGNEHPDALVSMANLASTYKSQGRWKEAEELGVQVMGKMRAVLGEEHSNTLTSMANLASTYQYQEQWKEAEELWVQVVETSARVLGAEHPDTLTGRANLASTYQNQGRWREAEALFVQVIGIMRKVLGDEYPDTIACINNLAFTFKALGRTQEAISLMRECLQLQEQTLGPQHPDTASSLEVLMLWAEESGIDI